MWLLSTSLTQLQWFTSADDIADEYAILSHCWGPKEQTFQEIKTLLSDASDTYPGEKMWSRTHPKIRGFCALAKKHGYNWAWIDACCIDKTSSSELSEAINSMYQWYGKAAICYAYLEDVSSDDLNPGSEFRRSRWFTRGWTLQELIAPTSLLFILSDWKILGTRKDIVTVLEDITTIDATVLLHDLQLSEVSVSRRMSWAASRQTTRVEDEAYCLMGIFGINMHTLYGEGRASFYRLQEEIMKIAPDETIFAWGPSLKLSDFFTHIDN